MKFLTNLLGDWLTPVLVSAVVFLLLSCAAMKLDIAFLEHRLDAAKSFVAALKSSNTSLTASLNNQNAAIDRMREEAMAREAAARAAAAKAEQKAVIYERNAMALMARTPTGDECAATKALLEEYTR